MFEEIITFLEELFGAIEHLYNPENMDYSYNPFENEQEIDQETWDQFENYGVDTEVERTYYYELDNFDPAKYESMEGVYGYPDRAVDLWEEQEGNRCALYAQKFIIEEITGLDLDIEKMVAVAEAYGWFSEERGTPLAYMNEMLNYCGIENETLNCSGYDEFKSYIQNGDRIIVAIDSDEYWYGEYDNLYEGEAPDHAVEVIGIDESDPEHPMVILNDSGLPNGQGVRVPADTFMEAWEDSDYYMVRVPVNNN